MKIIGDKNGYVKVDKTESMVVIEHPDKPGRQSGWKSGMVKLHLTAEQALDLGETLMDYGVDIMSDEEFHRYIQDHKHRDYG